MPRRQVGSAGLSEVWSQERGSSLVQLGGRLITKVNTEVSVDAGIVTPVRTQNRALESEFCCMVKQRSGICRWNVDKTFVFRRRFLYAL